MRTACEKQAALLSLRCDPERIPLPIRTPARLQRPSVVRHPSLHAERVLQPTWRAWRLRRRRGRLPCGWEARACVHPISCATMHASVHSSDAGLSSLRSSDAGLSSLHSCGRRSCELHSCVRHSCVRHSCALGPFFSHSYGLEISGYQNESRLFFHPSSHDATTFWLQPYYELRYRGSVRQL